MNIPVNYLSKLERIRLYSRSSFNYLNMEAVFSDETLNYVSNNEPENGEKVTIKLRTAKDNVTKASIFVNDQGSVDMEKTGSDLLFDYFSVSVEIYGTVSYYFLVQKEERCFYYNKLGVSRDLDVSANFRIIADFKTPDWAKGSIMYQIYVDRFCNGDESNDVVNNEYAYLGKAAKKKENWFAPLSNEDICNFYGGDLKGVCDKLSYLKDLGVEAIYFNPIFVSPSNHKYDIQDYDYVDPHIGRIVKDEGEPLYFERFKNHYATKYMCRTTSKENLEASNQLLVELIELAHSMGIKVILDGVFNHCGAFNKWLDKEGFYAANGYPVGAYASQDSPYNSYFRFYTKNWPNNDCYDGWWGYDNHPKLNFEDSPKLFEYMMQIAKKWVSPPFNADGWRLDVAADLGYSKEFNHKFWREFRKAVKEANPNAIILAEHYGNPADWLQGDQWDTIMNYDAFMEPITWFLTGMEKHSEEFQGHLLSNSQAFKDSMTYNKSKMNIQSLQISMNQLSNHDHSRFLTRTNMRAGRLHTHGADAASDNINLGIMMEAVMFQMTWDGAPTIYYGDEAGLCGWTDPDNRRTYPWGHENKALIDFHKALINIRKSHKALRTGSTEFLLAEDGIVSFCRYQDDEQFVVILNNNPQEKTIRLPIWKLRADMLKSLITSDQNGFSEKSETIKTQNGFVSLTLPPYSGCVYEVE